MKAVVIEDTSTGPVLRVTDAPVPVAAAGEILIKVRAAGVNRADLVRAKSHFGSDSVQAFAIAGMEVAGEVEACGAGVTRFKVGDAVIAMAPRSYAEFCVVHETIASLAPKGLDWPQALAACTSFITAHDALITNAMLQSGESVFVQGAGSAAGLAAVQIAAWRGAKVIAGSSGKGWKLDRLREFGLNLALPRPAPEHLKTALDATAGKGFDVIADNVGHGALGFNIDAAAVRGRIVSVGRLGGYEDTLNIDELARKRLHLIGVTFRSRTLQEHAAVVRAYERDLMPAFASGMIKPVVDRVFSLDQASEAQQYMTEDRHFGKIVLTT